MQSAIGFSDVNDQKNEFARNRSRQSHCFCSGWHLATDNWFRIDSQTRSPFLSSLLTARDRSCSCRTCFVVIDCSDPATFTTLRSGARRSDNRNAEYYGATDCLHEKRRLVVIAKRLICGDVRRPTNIDFIGGLEIWSLPKRLE